MFTEIINLIDPIPQQYVDSINRISNEPDYSLTCMGIALLKSRIENYNGISGKFCNIYGEEKRCLDDFFDVESKHDGETPLFCYYSYTSKYEDESEEKAALADKGYVIKETIGALLQAKASVKCIAAYNEEKNSAVVLINSRNLKFYHLLLSFLSLLLPSLFKEKPLTEADIEIVKTLSKSDGKAFITRIRQAIEPYAENFRRMLLSGLMKSMHEKKIASAYNNVENQRMAVRNAEQSYAEAMRALKNYIVVYEGMKVTEEYTKADEDLVEYLTTNQLIHNMSLEGSVLQFSVATILNNYNEDAWRTFSERGYIYSGSYDNDGRHDIQLLDVFKDKNNRKIFLDSLFCESPEFGIKIAGNYKIDFDSCCVTTARNYNYVDKDPMYASYVPNPHLKIFSCLGGYERRINKAVQEGNYIGAIEMCCASAGSVDLDETEQTFRPFLGWVMSSREKILRRKDGVEMTPEEALIYMIDKEKSK